MSDTPLTSGLQSNFSQYRDEDLARLWNLARTLERELTQARASLKRVDADYEEECQKRAHVQSLLNAARAEIATLTAEVARLKASAEIDWSAMRHH